MAVHIKIKVRIFDINIYINMYKHGDICQPSLVECSFNGRLFQAAAPW